MIVYEKSIKSHDYGGTYPTLGNSRFTALALIAERKTCFHFCELHLSVTTLGNISLKI